MKINSFSPKKALLIARLIFLSMFVASLVFIVLVFTIRTGKYSFRVDSFSPFTFSPLIIFCIAIPAGYFYAKRLLNKTEINDSLSDKFALYQKVLIVKLAACEIVTLYSVAFLLITGNLFGILIAIAALFVMWTNFPNIDKISSLLNLKQSEIEKFQ